MAYPTYHKELIDGCEVEKPLPKNLHAFAETFLLVNLATRLPRRYEALPELNVLCGADRLVPDVVIAERSARYDDGDLADPPLLAIEIMSPGQRLSELFDRCERLHKAGTPQCWVIWPERRQAWMFTPVSLEAAKENLTASVGESTIEVSVAEMWSELD